MTDSSSPDPNAAYEAAKAAQAVAATPGQSAWVAANAGSGKTKVLIDRVARLLLQGAEPDTILCVTYTKAAASEMQGRLFGVLGDWSVMETGKLKAALAELEGRDNHTDDEIGRARALFARALETPGGLRIETIHAFCGRVLRRFPLEAGVAPGFRELDEAETGTLWESAVRALGKRVAARSDEPLMDAARCVVEAGGGPGLDVLRTLDARRGDVERFLATSGDVETAIERLRVLLKADGDSAEAIIARTMGADLPRDDLLQALAAYRAGGKQDAAQADRIELALSDAPDDVRFNAYLGVILTQKGELKARKSIASKAAVAASPVVLSLFDVETPEGSESRRLQAALQAVKAARILERSAALVRLAEVIFADFAWRKGARAGLDFDDLIDAVSRLLTPGASDAAEWVLWKLDGGVAHVLLDEAQDTSPAQWNILENLTGDMFAGLGVERKSPRTLFVVGDQKQSIYSFQGADPEHFLRQGRLYRQRADGAELKLATPHLAMSFRSVPEVLGFVDETFDPAFFDGGAPFSLEPPDEADVARHAASRNDHVGGVDLWPLSPPAKTDEPDPWTAPVDQQSESSPKVQLARRVATFVAGEIARSAAVWDRGAQRPARPGDFLILVKGRTGGLFDALLQSLKRAGLPVAGADRLQLLDSLAVQDLLNLVRFALCPEDDLVLAEILKGPFGRVKNTSDKRWLDDDDLYRLSHGRGRSSLWSRLLASGDPRCSAPRTFLTEVLERSGLAPFDLLAFALEQPHPAGPRGWDLVLSRFGDPAREPVAALLDRAAAFDADAPPSLETFLAAIERHGGEVKRELSGPQDEVRVMTVHGAKGLEAPIVILPDSTAAPRYDTSGLFVASDGAPVWVGLKEGDTPVTAAMREESKQRALREHRRLLYVALTRAKDRLVVCGAWSGKPETAGRPDESWYALCERAMARLAERGAAATAELVLDGDALTVMRAGAAPPAVTLGQDSAPGEPTTPEWTMQAAAPEPRVRRILSPSALGATEPPVMTPFGAGRETRLRRGRLIHTLFQHLPDIAPERRRDSARAFLSRQPDLSEAARDEMLTAAFGVIEDPRFAAVFAPGGRAEAPVIGQWGPDVVNGRIDRLVVTESEVLVVDFKTDRPAPPQVESVGAAYLMQMGAYRDILHQSWPDHSVRCLLAWTDGPQLMEIPASLMDRALESAAKTARL